jgi:hypothetical protein
MRAHTEVTKWLVALAQKKQADAQHLAQLIKDALAKDGVTNVEVLGAAGPVKIGGVVQERAEADAAPVCPAGSEVQQRPDTITPKATMHQRTTAASPAPAPQPAPQPAAEPAKPDDGAEIEMGN